jgi:cytochrome c oxidase subunit II
MEALVRQVSTTASARRASYLGITALVLALALAGCGGGEEEPAGGGMETALSQEAAAGKKLFVRQLCTGCHTLAAVEGSEGVAGPKLDQSLEGDDAAYIRQSIVDPGAVLDPRFPKTIMPATGPEAAIPSRRITDEEVDQIVAFLLTTQEN